MLHQGSREEAEDEERRGGGKWDTETMERAASSALGLRGQHSWTWWPVDDTSLAYKKINNNKKLPNM